MSFENQDDECPGCRPAILNAQTGQVEPADSPIMQTVNRVWESTTKEERTAFHRVCCQNSREPADIEVMKSIGDRIQRALAPNPAAN